MKDAHTLMHTILALLLCLALLMVAGCSGMTTVRQDSATLERLLTKNTALLQVAAQLATIALLTQYPVMAPQVHDWAQTAQRLLTRMLPLDALYPALLATIPERLTPPEKALIVSLITDILQSAQRVAASMEPMPGGIQILAADLCGTIVTTTQAWLTPPFN